MPTKEINWEKVGALSQWIIGANGILLWCMEQNSRSAQVPAVVDWETIAMRWVPPLLIALAIIIGALLRVKAASIAKGKQRYPPDTSLVERTSHQ